MHKMKLNTQLRDYSDEYTSTSLNIDDIDGIVRTWADAELEADDFVTNVQAHTVGTVVKTYLAQPTMAEDDSRPASAYAQREMGFRFYLRDSVNSKLSSFTLGTADLSIGSVVAGKDELDLTASPTSTFVTWIEANVLSADGNAVTVERAVIVGRNS